MKHRWPRSLHCQVEAVFHCIRGIGDAKDENLQGIRSFGSWRVYKYEAHQFADWLIQQGIVSILDAELVVGAMAVYFREKLNFYAAKKRSRQTFETTLAGMGKFAYAINQYIQKHELDSTPLDIESLRKQFYNLSKKLLPASSRSFDNRAFPDPIRLIQEIKDPIYQLQAMLQYEGGFRCEGVGAPRQRRLKNPLTGKALQGIWPDPVTEMPVGRVVVAEKGGKETCHLISLQTYRRLESFIHDNGKLESDYYGYIEAINNAAKETGQFVAGRGSHGLKHNFAEERSLECVRHGLTHEQSSQQTSIEMAHFRLNETIVYTRGHK
jgi:hypothetical protein